jgi:pimeloyl-ACP methyl ester carboxylesterase
MFGVRPLRRAMVGRPVKPGSAPRPKIVLMHGFGMRPDVYLPMAELLAEHADVVIPDLFDVRGWWTPDRVLDSIELTLAEVGVDRMTLLGHSFGGALVLGLAARNPTRVVECVFSDTLGVNREMRLAFEAVHPVGIARMATQRAATAFVRTWVGHPVPLATAALWAFVDNRDPDCDVIAAARIPCHVLWAETDTVLSRDDGRDFARRLDADFTVAERPHGYGPIDHDWMFDDPDLFAAHLKKLHLHALT